MYVARGLHISNAVTDGCSGTNVVGAKTVKEMVAKLKKPRRVMMLVKAGSAVDSFIEQLLPFLEKGDIVIDGGNSEYLDSIVSFCVCCL